MSFQKNLEIPSSTMRRGLAFVWADVSRLEQVLSIFEEKGFVFVENFTVVLLTRDVICEKKGKPKVKKITDFFNRNGNCEALKNPKDKSEDQLENHFKTFLPEEIMMRESHEYFKKSKKNLLLLRRYEPKGNSPLELRHQRTSDVVFTFANDFNTFFGEF